MYDLKIDQVREALNNEIQLASQSGKNLLKKRMLFRPLDRYFIVEIENVTVYTGCSDLAAVTHYNRN